MVQLVGKATIQFNEKFHIRGMSQHKKSSVICVNIFHINGRAYYGFGKNKAYPFTDIINKRPQKVVFH